MGLIDLSGNDGDDTVVVDVLASAAPAPAAWPSSAWSRLRSRAYSHLVDPWAKLSAGDISGSLGDLGTFLPLTVALVNTVGLDLGTTLIFSGIYNVYSGAAFGVPIPVQPMKSIAAVAITEDGLSLDQTLLAGFIVSAFVFTLGVTKLIDAANRLVHESVIRGIQVGIGLKLAIKGADMVMFTAPGGPWRHWLGAHGLLLGTAAALYVLFAVVKFQPGGALDGACRSHVADDAAGDAADGLVATAHACSPSSAQQRQPMVDGHASTGTPAGGTCTPAGTMHAGLDAPSQAMAGVCPPTHRTTASRDGAPPIAGGGRSKASHSAAPCSGDTDAEDTGSDPEGPARTETRDCPRDAAWSISRCRARTGAAPGASTPLSAPQHAQHTPSSSLRRACTRVARAAAAFPPALLLVLVGVVVTLVDTPAVLGALSFGPATPKILRPAAEDWWPAFTRAALPQLPLTLLNSVIAVTLLSHELFPAVPLTMPHVAASVGVMNAIGPWFGAMPCCHGAGGLAAQARFGARSGGAPMLLGAVKLTAGVAAGGSLLPLLRAFPQPLLGVLLVFSGAELATTASKLPQDKRYWLLMMITAATAMAKDTGLGFLVGLLSTWLVKEWKWPWRATPSSSQQSV